MREAKEVFLILTGWILMDFSAFAPKWAPAELGTANWSLKTELFQGLSLQNFLPTSENSFLFLPDLLPTIYYLLRLRQPPFILQPKRPSQCIRNALHIATETPFLFLQKCTPLRRGTRTP
jgi:hypothetical protein